MNVEKMFKEINDAILTAEDLLSDDLLCNTKNMIRSFHDLAKRGIALEGTYSINEKELNRFYSPKDNITAGSGLSFLFPLNWETQISNYNKTLYDCAYCPNISYDGEIENNLLAIMFRYFQLLNVKNGDTAYSLMNSLLELLEKIDFLSERGIDYRLKKDCVLSIYLFGLRNIMLTDDSRLSNLCLNIQNLYSSFFGVDDWQNLYPINCFPLRIKIFLNDDDFLEGNLKKLPLNVITLIKEKYDCLFKLSRNGFTKGQLVGIQQKLIRLLEKIQNECSTLKELKKEINYDYLLRGNLSTEDDESCVLAKMFDKNELLKIRTMKIEEGTIEDCNKTLLSYKINFFDNTLTEGTPVEESLDESFAECFNCAHQIHKEIEENRLASLNFINDIEIFRLKLVDFMVDAQSKCRDVSELKKLIGFENLPNQLNKNELDEFDCLCEKLLDRENLCNFRNLGINHLDFMKLLDIERPMHRIPFYFKGGKINKSIYSLFYDFQNALRRKDKIHINILRGLFTAVNFEDYCNDIIFTAYIDKVSEQGFVFANSFLTDDEKEKYNLQFLFRSSNVNSSDEANRMYAKYSKNPRISKLIAYAEKKMEIFNSASTEMTGNAMFDTNNQSSTFDNNNDLTDLLILYIKSFEAYIKCVVNEQFHNSCYVFSKPGGPSLRFPHDALKINKLTIGQLFTSLKNNGCSGPIYMQNASRKDFYLDWIDEVRNKKIHENEIRGKAALNELITRTATWFVKALKSYQPLQ